MTEQAIQEATPAPITTENVVTEPTEPPAPDSSILTTRLNTLLQDPEPKSDLEKLQEQINSLQLPSAPEPTPKKDAAMENELKELREAQTQLRTELQSRVEQQEMSETSKEVAQWVTSNSEHFPLINEAGYQPVVMQKILNTKQQTGRVIDAAQAGKEVEEELSALVKRCAPKMGYVMRDKQATRGDEEQISTTTGGLNIAVPPDWDNMTDDEQMEYLVRQVEG